MIALLLAGVAAASTCSPNDAVKVLRGAEGDLKEAYLCLAGNDAGDDLLVAGLDVTGAAPSTPPVTLENPAGTVTLPPPALDDDAIHARLTRALALWLLQHADVAWDPALVRRLPAVDRRFVADGVRARSGRASPAPEHAKVFANFDWYKPIPNWTEARLSPVDRANIAMADDPPPAPPPPPPTPEAEKADALPPPNGAPTKGCGCATGGGTPALGVVLLGLTGLVFSRRRDAAPGRDAG